MPQTKPTQAQPSISALTPRSTQTLALDGELQVWERQPTETDQHWGWFQLYRDLHPSIRSVARAYALYKEEDAPEAITATLVANREMLSLRAPGWFEAVATSNQWPYRAKAYDEWADQDLLERLQSTRVRHLAEVADIGRRLREKAAKALEVLEVVTYEVIIDDEGNPRTIEISSLTPAAIAQLARLGVDLERDALNLGRGGQGGGLTVNIANVVGGQATGRLPNPDDDDRLINRVEDILRHRQENHRRPSASVELTGTGDDGQLITVQAETLPAVKAKPKGKATPTPKPKPGVRKGMEYTPGQPEPPPGGRG